MRLQVDGERPQGRHFIPAFGEAARKGASQGTQVRDGINSSKSAARRNGAEPRSSPTRRISNEESRMDGAVAGRGPLGPGSGTAKLDHFGPVAADRAAAGGDPDPDTGRPELATAGHANRQECPDRHPDLGRASAPGGGQEAG